MSNERLYGKYIVKKANGEPVKNNVFILSPETDEAAMQALATYQECIEGKNPELAHDLGLWLIECGFIHSEKVS